jgi:hypothetical protein
VVIVRLNHGDHPRFVYQKIAYRISVKTITTMPKILVL